MKSALLHGLLTLLFLLNLSAKETAPQQQAQHISQLLLQGKTLNVNEQKQLASLVYQHPDLIKEQLVIAKLTGDQQTSANARKALKSLDGDAGIKLETRFLGATVGWHLLLNHETIESRPLIISVEKGSLAEKAKLLPGDVIEQCGPFKLSGDSTRNQFVRFIGLWPKSEPLILKIRRSNKGPNSPNAVKKVKKTLTLFNS